ncbi:hypothetical protein DDE82_005060 [Stemphylium lycopersici]|uniref:DUF7730 domain-containing protein n=1 Tax=Stemphylium lycopersici TaxID=183478 RepID=A0A364N6F6_STELY|nr:hypothetical protein TW65_05434 [Stemphylium lycopersici]RAR03570.1 hypothetical protein DDE82_005060 [Stemphylium lycopersici]RAR12915.1 hypothetical protein DDE83_003713 [Stemphylium lycopersici]
MSNDTVLADTFASGRYSKRKRTQVTYHLDDLAYSDAESDYESPQTKVRRTINYQKPKATKMSKRLPKHKTFPFMQLPAEIRNMIYGYTLNDPDGINLAGTFKHRRRTVQRISEKCQSENSGGRMYPKLYLTEQLCKAYEDPAPLTPALLAVSKQIYQEGIDVLYGNEFIFTDSFALYSFMLNLGPVGAKHVKSVHILGWHDGRAMKAYNHSCFATLAWATNLTALHIDAPMGSYRASKDGALQLYRDAFPWLEAVGAAKGKPDAALDLLQLGENCFSERWSLYGARTRRPDHDEERIERFKDALRKLLGAHQKRIMAKIGKKRKGAKAVVADA